MIICTNCQYKNVSGAVFCAECGAHAVLLLVLAEPILELLFGARFEAATTPLRLLALTVVPLGVSMLMWTLITSRREPRVLLIYAAVTLAVNVALNLALIPTLGADGAAAAMLATYVVAAVVMLRVARATVGPLRGWRTVGGPLVAGIAMALVTAGLEPWVFPAALIGLAVYSGVLMAVERKLAPDDLDFMLGMLRRLLRSPRVSTLPVEQSERL